MDANTGIVQSVGEDKKNITVQIFGAEYPIAGAKDPQHLEELARYVDAKMRDIAKGSPLLSAGKVAILAALNMAEELYRLRAVQQRLRETAGSRIAQLVKKIDKHAQKA